MEHVIYILSGSPMLPPDKLTTYTVTWINEGTHNPDEGIRHLRICASIQDTAHARRARTHLDARLGRFVGRRTQCRAQLLRCAFSLPPSILHLYLVLS
jgi:hypothetical protein